MDAKDLILVSVDDHLVEPPEIFQGRLPTRFVDAAPRIEHTPDGSDVWIFNGNVIPNIGLNAVAGRPKEEYGFEPVSTNRCVKVASTDARIEGYERNGVLGSMCFGSFPGFAGARFATNAGQGARARDHTGLQRLAFQRLVRVLPG